MHSQTNVAALCLVRQLCLPVNNTLSDAEAELVPKVGSVLIESVIVSVVVRAESGCSD